MSYRVSTKFQPYQLVFGKPMNEFMKYSEVDDSAYFELMVLRRTFEIQRLFQDYIYKSRLNITIAQDKQRHYQDKSHKIVEKLYQGSIVYIKTPSLLVKNKLEERFIGSYKVDCTSAKGDYWLLNERNELLKNSYPITRLKIVERNKESIDEMEVIKDTREINGKKQ